MLVHFTREKDWVTVGNVSTFVVQAVSMIMRRWLSEMMAARASTAFDNRTEDVIINLEGLTADEVFVNVMNAIDSNQETCSNTFFERNLRHLVKPFHKYDCPGLWRKLLLTLDSYPDSEVMIAIDNLETAIDPRDWMTRNMARFIRKRLSCTTDRCSDRMMRQILILSDIPEISVSVNKTSCTANDVRSNQ